MFLNGLLACWRTWAVCSTLWRAGILTKSFILMTYGVRAFVCAFVCAVIGNPKIERLLKDTLNLLEPSGLGLFSELCRFEPHKSAYILSGRATARRWVEGRNGLVSVVRLSRFRGFRFRRDMRLFCTFVWASTNAIDRNACEHKRGGHEAERRRRQLIDMLPMTLLSTRSALVLTEQRAIVGVHVCLRLRVAFADGFALALRVYYVGRSCRTRPSRSCFVTTHFAREWRVPLDADLFNFVSAVVSKTAHNRTIDIDHNRTGASSATSTCVINAITSVHATVLWLFVCGVLCGLRFVNVRVFCNFRRRRFCSDVRHAHDTQYHVCPTDAPSALRSISDYNCTRTSCCVLENNEIAVVELCHVLYENGGMRSTQN